jgi:hypothetical protein
MRIQGVVQFMLFPLCAWQIATAQPNKMLNALTSAKGAQMSQGDAGSAMSGSSTANHTRTRANAKVTVQNSEAKPYDSSTGPVLTEIQITETFSGDIDGESTVRALQLQRADKSSSQVSLQRFSGALKGRRGTFVLQGSETVTHGQIKASWFVIPGSGTGDLTGLRGEGGFKGAFGKGSDGWLDYWFE